MTQAPLEMLQSEFSDDLPLRLRESLIGAANKTYNDFKGAFYLLAVARDLTAHSRPICKEEHIEIGK